MRRRDLSLGVFLVTFWSVGCGSPPARTPRLALDVLTPDQAAFLSAYQQGLERLATRSATADSLLKFFQAHAVPGQPVSDHQFIGRRPLQHPHDFYVVPVLSETVQVHRATFIVGRYDKKPNAITLWYNDFTPLVRGMYLGHEIVHAYRHLVRGAPPDPALSPGWVREEVIAHFTVSQILNQYTDSGWSRAVSQGFDLRSDWVTKQLQSIEPLLDEARVEDVLMLATLFGAQPGISGDLVLLHYRHDLHLQWIFSTSEDSVSAVERIQRHFRDFYAARLQPR